MELLNIENKNNKKNSSRKLPIWVEYIKKKEEKSKKNQTNNGYFLSTNKKLHFKLDLKMNIKKNMT